MSLKPFPPEMQSGAVFKEHPCFVCKAMNLFRYSQIIRHFFAVVINSPCLVFSLELTEVGDAERQWFDGLSGSHSLLHHFYLSAKIACFLRPAKEKAFFVASSHIHSSKKIWNNRLKSVLLPPINSLKSVFPCTDNPLKSENRPCYTERLHPILKPI